ncbi:hypothetical protein [Rhodoferax sp.]|uniref:hypothetical protein n=1 Tax=Rhodoferax sp. TaxID=50421 RepID=UPI00374CF49D
MLFKNSDEAKSFAVVATSRRQSYEEATQSIQYFQENLERAKGEGKEIWEKHIQELETWLASDEYKKGDYPQGIDELMLELVEWRASIFSLQKTETKKSPFTENVFFQQWLIGGVYATYSLLGKLTGNDPREKSLRNLWWKVYKHIARDGACKTPELKRIQEKLEKATGQFTDSRSKGILFRNTVIAHNQKSIVLDWNEIDDDIRVLIRIWSLIVSWSSFGIISPFRKGEKAFSGLEYFFDQQELTQLYKNRQEYIDKCIGWARTYLHDDKFDPGGYFMAKISLSTNIAFSTN